MTPDQKTLSANAAATPGESHSKVPSVTVEVVTSIREIDQSAWRDLEIDSDPLWDWNTFRLLEESGVGPDFYEYVLVFDDRQLVAIAPAFGLRRYRLDLSPGRLWRIPASGLRSLWPGFATLGLYFCGHPMGRGRILGADAPDYRLPIHDASGSRRDCAG